MICIMITKQQAKKRIIISLVSICILVVLWIILKYIPTPSPETFLEQKIVTIGSTPLSVEIADNDIERAKGLSGRKSLDNDAGMLFIFDHAEQYSFWMPDMYFPIDIIWINDGVIVGIEKNVSNIFDSENPGYYYPPVAVNTVLEVNAMFTEINNIKVGDKITVLE